MLHMWKPGEKRPSLVIAEREIARSLALLLTVGSCFGQVAISTNANLGVTGRNVTLPLQATGGTPPYVWSVREGSMPPGVYIRPDAPPSFTANYSAVIDGIATAAGRFSFMLEARDATGATATRSFTWVVAPLLAGSSLNSEFRLPTALIGTPYSTQVDALDATGPVSFMLATPNSLPPGLRLEQSNGRITGVPTAAGIYSFTVVLTDSLVSARRSVALEVVSMAITTPSSLPAARQGKPFSVQLAATGGSPPYTWSVNPIPGGLSLNAATGTLAGAAVGAVYQYHFTATARDRDGLTARKVFAFQVLPKKPVRPAILSPVSGNLPDAVLAEDVRILLNAGGEAPYEFSASGLPPGLHLTSSDSVMGASSGADAMIYGVASKAGSYEVVVSARDSSDPPVTTKRSYRWNVVPISPGPLPAADVGQTYDATLHIHGGKPPFRWTALDRLPQGLVLNPATGRLTGVPVECGLFNVSFRISDSLGQELVRQYVLSMRCGTISFSNQSIPDMPVGRFYSFAILAGGQGRTAFSVVDGEIPPGYTFSSAGVLAGSSTRPGLYTFLVKAEDALGTGLRRYYFRITALQPGSAQATPGQEGKSYWHALSAYGGQAPYRWSADNAKALPSGLVLSADGILSGIPLAPGSYRFGVVVADAAGGSGSFSLGLEVTATKSQPARGAPVSLERGFAVVVPTEYDSPIRNPLGGPRPWAPHGGFLDPYSTLTHMWIPWNDLENDESDGLERIKAVSDRYFSGTSDFATLPVGIAANNIKAVPRVVLFIPGSSGGSFWPSDMMQGDYSSEQFIRRITRLILRLGEAWDNDPRVAYVEMGILGFWGEEHDPWYPNTLGLRPVVPAAVETAIGDAYQAAFPNKRLMHRLPWNFAGYDFGINWDIFGAPDSTGFAGIDTTLWTQALQAPQWADNWKRQVRGGEFDASIFGESSMTDVMKKHSDRLSAIARQLHWNHVGNMDVIDVNDSTVAQQYSTFLKSLSYRFVIRQAAFSATAQPGGGLTIRLSIENTGSSPIYYNWPLEVSLLDPKTHQPAWKATWQGIDLRSWLPGEVWSGERSFVVPDDLKVAQYALAVAILDPAGMSPAVRFAVVNYYNGGRSPLGLIGVGVPAATNELSDFDDIDSDFSLHYEANMVQLPAQTPPSAASGQQRLQ